MNDPGVDDPVREAAEDLEANPYQHQEKLEEEEEQDFLDPSRWWFASTACPLIAGTFGPMANAFSICALVQNWRSHIPPGGDEGHATAIKDPHWLIAINAVSLVFALIANFALLLNMARRLPFAIAQSITIVGWLMSSFLLIALVAVASSSAFRLEPRAEYALTQAFYYGIMAAALYCIVSLLMIITVIGAWRGHYEKEFRLTISQRTLMLQTIGFLMYLLVGAVIFKYIEGWEYLDAVYWADFTLLTVGIGSDFSPKTHLGRSLLFPFAIGGIVTVGLVIGSVRTLVLERGKHKMEARFTEKKREHVLDSHNPHKRTIKISTLKKYHFGEEGLTEPQRREQEFRIMRKIQESALTRRKWLALGLSTAAAMTLWLIGALVFKIAERNQQWSYFTSLYFAYTSLLTIGYGDFYPQSNSGKPFFVFWTLLAVPTLTILISNMGDTVVKSFSDFTIWAGSLTILPGENGARATLRATADKVTRGSLFRPGEFRTDKPPGFTPHNSDNDNSHALEDKYTLEDHALDRLANHVEGEELEEAHEAGERGDALDRDIHLYHYILARELRNLMKDIHASPPRKYSYSEWAWYLKLMGQDERNPDLHRKPPVKINREKLQKGDSGSSKEGMDHEYLGRADGGKGQDLRWSWLGTRSPLMGNKAEAEWLLERLGATLEHELRKLRSKNPEVQQEKPPISLDDLIKKKNATRKERGGAERRSSTDLEKKSGLDKI